MVLSAKHKDDAQGVPHYMGMKGKNLSIMLSTVATCGFLLFGYDQGVMSGIISATDFNNYFPQTKGDSTWQAFVTAIYEVGCLIGAIFQLNYGDRTGRRRAIMIGALVMIIGVVIQVTAFDGSHATAQFIVGRTVTGVGNGINTSTIPTYQAECSKSANRGLLICIEGGTIAIGTMIAYWIDYGASYGPPGLTWRFPIAFQIVFGIFIIVGMLFLPESPRWLLTKDRHEEATTVLAALRGLPREDEEIKTQSGIIVDSIRVAGAVGGNTPYRSLLEGGKTQHFRRVLLGTSSQFFQQIGGCNAVIYYFPLLFENSIGVSHNLALLLGGVNMIIYSIFATTSWFLVEKVGRRKLFLAGSIGQCCSMILVFACLIPGGTGPAKGAAVGFFTYIAFFGATWLPLPWLYPAEINPIKTRAKANAVSTCSNWLWNFTVVMFTPPFTDASTFGCYLFFAIINALFIPTIYFFYPETAGRSLEEIDLIFAKGYLENMSYVRASHQLPKLDEAGIDQMGREYGFVDDDDEAGKMKDARFWEKEDELAEQAGGQMV
ncbi:general substrate transporter [Hortaea werneckii]|uniref:Major facilitator superfamily (MFS) profile domain-containing protein n=2 Tax=Hortaea werneckii TaxID=91943 RepID=A0A3M7I6H1_HORWE|nr:general substrate transporter [Hortaea werneckii]KAI6841446.1 general substrate transporter [Hortaea werneckii]KAI6906133.1 general substrate transporter [Hortaea werneckii]KAI6939009.1 general substrate transporter [Hortaea werneckii]KAI6967637.1 general substrate transporter [Hortaea werneckii]